MPAGLPPPQRIDERSFKVIIWTFTAIAFPFVLFRLFVRWKVFRKLFADDAFVVLSSLFSLMYAILWQDRARDLYIVFGVGSGAAKPEADYLDHLRRYVTARIVYAFLYPFSLWSIKFAFLLFFRRLGRQAGRQMILWWSVLACNMLCIGAWYGVPVWRCTINSIQYISTSCSDQGTANRSQIALRLQTTADVVSDASIILIPVSLLWNLQVSIWKKLGLIGLFSMTIFVMIASIIRVVVAKSVATDPSWCFAWGTVEMSTAIIVACLASFRALFTANNTSQRLRRYQEEGQRNDLEHQRPPHLGFRNTGPGSNDFGAGHQSIPLAALELALVKTLTLAHPGAQHSRSTVDGSLDQA